MVVVMVDGGVMAMVRMPAEDSVFHKPESEQQPLGAELHSPSTCSVGLTVLCVPSHFPSLMW
jgi:hypothetical protein